MYIFRPFCFMALLIVSAICLGLPITTYCPVSKDDTPAVVKKPVRKKISAPEKIESGPSQPEVQTFKPADASNLVDLFSGDFSYNIPLLDVGGYPVNLFYTSNIGMEDEASWVGLGFNLNAGAINRNVRGLPDDFSGEPITKTFNIKKHEIFGGTTGVDFELYGFGISATIGIKHNNYTGIGLDLGAGVSYAYSAANGLNAGVSANLGLSSDAGATISPSVNLSYSTMNEDQRHKSGNRIGVAAGMSWNSLDGLGAMYIAPSFTRRANNYKHADFTLSQSFPLTFARQTYTPSVNMPTKNLSLNFRLKIGGEIQGGRIAGSISAFYNSQTLEEKSRKNPAYGYLYAHNGKDDAAALHDFNRENDGPFEVQHPQLPVLNPTYDVYTVTGHGISGNFRPFRNDIGTVSDPSIEVVSNGGGAGVDVAAGLIAKIGADIEFSESKTYSGKWTSSSNESKDQLQFRRKSDVAEIRYEPAYFKNVGEKNVLVNKNFYNLIGKKEAIAIKLEGDMNAKAKPTVVTGGTSTPLSTATTVKNQREQRNINFQYLTVEEAQYLANQRVIKVYTGNADGDTVLLERASRNNYTIGGKQMSQIIILNDDGTRYVYGLPAYNFIKQEVSFNISNAIPRATVDSISMMSYSTGDNSSNNNRGTNHYFNEVETPPYAYAYYITEILSADYVDIHGDGPTGDDLGTFTKFTYYRDSLYRWRSPHQQNQAFFNAGNLYDQKDDMGNYQYGEKEIFYLRTIETRNHIAVFDLSDRKDALGVVNKDGGKDVTSKLKKLQSIALYTKSAYLKNNKTPVKKVNFEYDYSLCRKNPSSEADSGKLTLKRVYLTYQRSGKGKKHAFNFRYDGMNPQYAVGASDRWGTYKSLKKRAPASGGGITEQNRSIANNEFPYTDQEFRKIQADSFASAWALTSVRTPEGATIKVQYEADDYAFVQDKRAMQLLQVLGFSSTANGSVSANLYSGNSPNNFLHFRTTQPVNSATAQELLKDIDKFYFTARVNITGPAGGSFGEKLFEPVDGFFLLKMPISVVVIDSQHVVIEINPEGNYHPFSIATLKRIKSDYPGVAYEFPQISENVLDDIANAFAGLARSAGDLLSGGLFNRMRGEGVAGEIIPSKSFVRMNVPNYIKIGGGSRVKRIEISDEWKSMSSSRDSTKNYSSEYDYTRIGDNNQMISSGVAAYEPPQGGNESPFLMPEYYNVSKKFSFMGIDLFEVENERKYVIGHYGESFFPGASVGYSQVTVKNNTDPQIKKHSTGRSVYTFYTAYDFPTIALKTPTEVKKFKQFLPFLIYNSNVDRVAASQGFYFEMNDMHGKEKSMFDYSTTDSVHPINGKTYYYRTSNKTLINDARVIDRNGDISEAEIGVETDILADERESSTYVKGPSVDINVDIILIGIFPIPIPVPVPKYSTEDILFRSTCLTKVSQRSGLIDSIVSFDGAARIVSRTLLYDAVTGREVLTSINNEFSDRIFTLNIPAHWVHEGMGPAFYNHGLEVPSIQVDASSIVTIPQADRLLFPGDEVFLVSGSTRFDGWVLQVRGDKVVIIDATGNKIPGSLNGASLKVIRSGRRNMHNISVGQIVTKENPVAGTRLALNAAKQIINSNAQEYSENWQTYAAFNVYPKKLTCNCASGVKTKDSNSEGFASALLSAIVANWQQGDSLHGYFYKLSLPQGQLQQYFNLNADSVCYTLETSSKDITINFFDCTNQKRICGAKLETNWLGELQFRTGRVTLSADIDGVSVDGCNDNGFRVAGNAFSVKGQFECLALRRCSLKYTNSDESQLCGLTQGDSIVNPYRLGLLGNYRPLKSLVYLTDRTTGPVRTAGVFSNYEPFWTSNAITNAQPSNWTWTEQNSRIDPYGKVLELKDTLGRYRAELFGFDNNLIVASAKNARYQQIAFMSFEDFDFKNTPNTTCWLPPHFEFNVHADSLITEDVSHTGRRSLQFRNNFDYSITRTAAPVVSPPSYINANGEYRMTNHELIGTFNPSAGDYYIEAWINMSNPALLSYHGLAELEVIIDLHDTLYFRPFGAIVDGWQKIGGRFSLQQGYNNVKFRFLNKSTNTGYMDDIRVHPFHAAMETYVYDPSNLKLMSTLDDNNFATIYEYDEEGMLTRVKKETYQGVLTVTEVRAGKPKQN